MSKQDLWNAIRAKGYSEKATAVILGHATAESGCECDRVQGDFSPNRSLSKRYTYQVDSGIIDRDSFVYRGPNGSGYGLVQWTYFSRKLGLYNTAKKYGMSIGSEKVAVEWLNEELHQAEYSEVLAALKSDRSIREISDVFMHKFEKPYDQSEAACAQRANFAQEIFNEFSGKSVKPDPKPDPSSDIPVTEFWPPRMIDKSMDGDDVLVLQSILLARGYSLLTANGIFDESTEKALKHFQADHKLASDGVCGTATWSQIVKLTR